MRNPPIVSAFLLSAARRGLAWLRGLRAAHLVVACVLVAAVAVGE